MCIDIYIYIYIYVYTSISLSLYIYIYMHSYIYLSLSLYIYTYVHIYAQCLASQTPNRSFLRAYTDPTRRRLPPKDLRLRCGSVCPLFFLAIPSGVRSTWETMCGEELLSLPRFSLPRTSRAELLGRPPTSGSFTSDRRLGHKMQVHSREIGHIWVEASPQNSIISRPSAAIPPTEGPADFVMR